MARWRAASPVVVSCYAAAGAPNATPRAHFGNPWVHVNMPCPHAPFRRQHSTHNMRARRAIIAGCTREVPTLRCYACDERSSCIRGARGCSGASIRVALWCGVRRVPLWACFRTATALQRACLSRMQPHCTGPSAPSLGRDRSLFWLRGTTACVCARGRAVLLREFGETWPTYGWAQPVTCEV